MAKVKVTLEFPGNVTATAEVDIPWESVATPHAKALLKSVMEANPKVLAIEPVAEKG